VAPLGAGTSTLTYMHDAAGRRTQVQVTGQTAVTGICVRRAATS